MKERETTRDQLNSRVASTVADGVRTIAANKRRSGWTQDKIVEVSLRFAMGCRSEETKQALREIETTAKRLALSFNRSERQLAAA